MQLNEQLVKKLKACEMLRSRGEQFIDGLYNALDQGKPVKLTNSKGHTVRFFKHFFKMYCGTELLAILSYLFYQQHCDCSMRTLPFVAVYSVLPLPLDNYITILDNIFL
jgi:hypothetical protein